jgi:stage V sporulation protein R
VKLKSSLPAVLKYQAVIIESAAREAGLDFFEVVFELLDASDVNGIASYGGFPVRYPSWRFGMEYERLEKGYTWGLSKIYELVINNDPTYAYLVRSNSLLEQKLVMAHVYGHADFFKNNVWFEPTERHMVDTIGNHATRVRRYIDAFGQERVEQFLDRALSLETVIDPYEPLRRQQQLRPGGPGRSGYTPLSERARLALDSLTASPLQHVAKPVAGRELRRAIPTYDILGFLAEHAPLEPWQHNVMRIVRREAYYFSPQRMTKIMNEGWASFWHSRLLTGGLLEASEILDFADTHSGATSTQGPGINPYKLGIELFRHAEASGEDLFRLRSVHNDVSLIDKLADESFTEQYLRPALGPHVPAPVDRRQMQVQEAPPPTWQAVKARVLRDLSWGGLPQIELVGVDAKGEGELVLVHHHDGRDLQLGQTGETLKNVASIWSAPVHLYTLEEGQGRLLVADEDEVRSHDTGEAEELCRSDRLGDE